MKTISQSQKPNVIFLHGYGNILAPQSSVMKTIMTKYYWKTWSTEAFPEVKVKFINWDCTRRIEAQLGEIVSQFDMLLENGHCPNGCMVVSHSTGGLVIDMLLARSLESKDTNNDFSHIWDAITFSLNIASAAGGVRLAATVSEIAMGHCNSLISNLIPFIECGKPSSMGAVHDLRPNEARFINHSDNVRTPSLMIAGSGFMAPDFIRTKLRGTNDGLVAMHSACGGNRYPETEASAPNSCSPFQSSDGTIRPQNASALYRQHYPIIMTEEGHLSQLHQNLLYFDFQKIKDESLIFYDDSGRIAPPPKHLISTKIRPTHTNDTADIHLPILIGKLFGTRPAEEPRDPNGPSTAVTRKEFLSTLKSIGKSYRNSLQYPLYSRPLEARDYSLLKPHKYYLEKKFFDNHSYSATLVLSQYLFFRGSKVPVDLILQNHSKKPMPGLISVDAEILDSDGITILFDNLQLLEANSEELKYHTLLDLDKADEPNLPHNINLKVTFTTVGGKKQVLTTMFKYLTSVGSIDKIHKEKIEDQHLIIPVSVRVMRKGTYKITANLFEQSSGNPISHIMSKSFIPGSTGTILLKIHARVLQQKRSPGPYTLKDFVLTRIPENLSQPRMFGDCSHKEFRIEGFELTKYYDLPEQSLRNPGEQEKLHRFLEFINSLD